MSYKSHGAYLHTFLLAQQRLSDQSFKLTRQHIHLVENEIELAEK